MIRWEIVYLTGLRSWVNFGERKKSNPCRGLQHKFISFATSRRCYIEKFEISSWRGARVGVRTYLLGWLRTWLLLRHKAGDVQGATPICDRLVSFQSLERQEVWIWIAGVARMHNGHVEVTAMPFGVNYAPAVFMKFNGQSKEEYESHMKMIVESVKEEKMYAKFSNNVEAEQRGSYLDVEGIKWYAWKREKVIACTSRQLKVLMKDCMANVVRTSIWRDVRTLAIEEAYTTKYSIHPGAETMLCGFRLTNRWLSMKKDIASCGSKYLAYSEVEVKYQGSSGLLLQP
ncbi:hypothetical protein Tco_0154764 [Tanacetum coccineum]